MSPEVRNSGISDPKNGDVSIKNLRKKLFKLYYSRIVRAHCLVINHPRGARDVASLIQARLVDHSLELSDHPGILGP